MTAKDHLEMVAKAVGATVIWAHPDNGCTCANLPYPPRGMFLVYASAVTFYPDLTEHPGHMHTTCIQMMHSPDSEMIAAALLCLKNDPAIFFDWQQYRGTPFVEPSHIARQNFPRVYL